MEKDHPERRYRKSPGRQYGYDYDPLRGQSGGSSRAGEGASRPGTVLIQRPDPRRTRQLMRQNILASKRSAQDDPEGLEYGESEQRMPSRPPEPRLASRATRRFHHTSMPLEDTPTRRPMHHYPEEEYGGPAHTPRYVSSPLPPTHEVMGNEDDHAYNAPAEPDLQEDDLYEAAPRPRTPRRSRRELVPRAFVEEREPGFVEEQYDFAAPDIPVERERKPRRAAKKTRKIAEPDEEIELVKPAVRGDDEYIYGENEELPPGLHPVKKGKTTRRALLIGGGVLIGALGLYAATSLQQHPAGNGDQSGPNGQDDFNRGVAQGTDAMRKQLIEAMDNLEGFTLEGALAAAKLLHGTYDVIVSPVIHFGSELSGDFLNAMLTAMKNARGYLAQVYQDNASLAAIQKVLEAWVDQVQKLPKQLDAITDTDLDGAQAYLQALQRKLEDEKKKLHATPTPQPKPKVTPTPTKKAQ